MRAPQVFVDVLSACDVDAPEAQVQHDLAAAKALVATLTMRGKALEAQLEAAAARGGVAALQVRPKTFPSLSAPLPSSLLPPLLPALDGDERPGNDRPSAHDGDCVSAQRSAAQGSCGSCCCSRQALGGMLNSPSPQP